MMTTKTFATFALLSLIWACGGGSDDPPTGKVTGASAVAPPAAAKKCTGTPSSCDSNGPPYCENVSGCYMRTDISYDAFGSASFDNSCDGTPDPCDRNFSQESCESNGCDWK